MNRLIRSTASPARAKIEARANRTAHCDKFPPCRFDRACLIEAPHDGKRLPNGVRPALPARQRPKENRTAHRRGKTKGKFGCHGGKVVIARPRLRGFAGKEQALPSWQAGMTKDRLDNTIGRRQRLMGPCANFRLFNGGAKIRGERKFERETNGHSASPSG